MYGELATAQCRKLAREGCSGVAVRMLIAERPVLSLYYTEYCTNTTHRSDTHVAHGRAHRSAPRHAAAMCARIRSIDSGHYRAGPLYSEGGGGSGQRKRESLVTYAPHLRPRPRLASCLRPVYSYPHGFYTRVTAILVLRVRVHDTVGFLCNLSVQLLSAILLKWLFGNAFGYAVLPHVASIYI